MKVDHLSRKNKNAMTRTEFINTFNSFPPKNKLLIVKQIQAQMSDTLFDEIDSELPDVEISMTEIINEVKAYRNARREKTQSRT